MKKQRNKIRNIHELTAAEQTWLAKAVITVFLSDNVVEESQVQYMKNLSKVFLEEEPKDTLKEISRLLKNKEVPELEQFEVEDPEHLIFMLNTLVSSIYANERKLEEEVKKYFVAGLKLGVTYEVLMLKLSYQKERFRIKMAQKEVDKTIREIVKTRKKKKQQED